jgi:rhomboid protease GluP
MYSIDGDKIRNAKITIILIITNVVCFIIFNQDYTFNLWYLMAQDNSLVLKGEVWRLITAIFIHADIMHLLSNMYGLFVFGVTVESFFNKREFLVAYLSCGVVGSIFTLIFFPPGTVSIGASGAIMGLMAISFVILARTDKRVLLFGILYIAFALETSFQPGIGTWAHVFGFLTGLLFGYLYLRKTNQLSSRKFYTSRPKRRY